MHAHDSIRLSDRILNALELALEQNDIVIADLLSQALDLSMTRKTGGGEFTEKRDYPEAMDRAMEKLRQLRGN